MLCLPIKDFKKWNVFDTPYKIKFKGIFQTMNSNNVFILESHGNIYSLEIDKNIQSVGIRFITHPQDFDALLDKTVVCYKYEDELKVDDNEDFKSNIIGVQEKSEKYYDKRTCTARTVNIKTIDLNLEVQNEINDNELKYIVDKFELVRDLFNIKNESLDEIIESKKLLNKMRDELDNIEEPKNLSKTLEDLEKITKGIENLLKGMGR